MRSRPSLAVLVVAAVAAVTFVVGGGAPTTYAAPAGCIAASNGIVLACDHSFPAPPRTTGLSIGLVGDSVLLGSSPGMSNPSLPVRLRQAGWGAIRMTTSLGMRTYNASNAGASAYHVLAKWKAAAFTPNVVVVNLGANHFTDCTTATVATCIARITQLLDRVTALYPAATVWWAKTNARSLITGSFQPGMLGWNLALDRVAAQQPRRLVVWDWPRALVTSHVVTDPSQIHPSSATQYAVRSGLISADVTARMQTFFAGPAVPVPNNANAPLGFAPADPTLVFDTTGGPLLGSSPSTGTPVSLASVAPAAGAAAVSVTVTGTPAAGWARITDCSADTWGTRIYFAAGQRRTVQAIVRLDGAQRFCLWSSVAATATVTLQGTFDATATDRFTPVNPTRIASFKAAEATVAVPGGAAVDAVAVTLAVDARTSTAGGAITVTACGAVPGPGTVHLSYAGGEATSAQVFTPLESTTGNLCVHVAAAGTLPTVHVLVTGHFSSSGQLRYRPVTVTRVLQMSPTQGTGGWTGRLYPGQAVTLGAPADARAVSMVVAAYEATAGVAIAPFARGAAPPTAAQGQFYGAAAPRLSSNTLTTAVRPTAGFAITELGTAIERLTVDIVGWWVP